MKLQLAFLLTVMTFCAGCNRAKQQAEALQAPQKATVPAAAPSPQSVTAQPKAVVEHRKVKPPRKQKCATGYDCTHIWSTYIP